VSEELNHSASLKSYGPEIWIYKLAISKPTSNTHELR